MKAKKLFMGVFLLVAMMGCPSKKQTVQDVTPLEVAGLLRNDFAVLVDVREKDEVADGMAVDAKWMPLSKIEAGDPAWQDFLKNLPKDKQIVFYCAAGARAGKVAAMVADKGFRTGNMGGFDDWAKAGLPVRKPGP